MVRAQHIAIRVSDIERSTEFYVQTLQGKLVLRPYTNNPRLTETFFGVKDTEYRIAYIELPDGFGIELFQFVPDRYPTIGVPQAQASVMHFAFGVDDLDGALTRGRAAGGSSAHDPGQWSPHDPARYVYLLDPDGNVVELNDSSWERILTSAVDLFPEAKP